MMVQKTVVLHNEGTIRPCQDAGQGKEEEAKNTSYQGKLKVHMGNKMPKGKNRRVQGWYKRYRKTFDILAMAQKVKRHIYIGDSYWLVTTAMTLQHSVAASRDRVEWRLLVKSVYRGRIGPDNTR